MNFKFLAISNVGLKTLFYILLSFDFSQSFSKEYLDDNVVWDHVLLWKVLLWLKAKWSVQV